VHVDVADFGDFFAAIDGRVYDGAVDEGDFLLDLLLPAAGVFVVGMVELGVGD
jgi:hypothetical protein